MLVTRNAVGRAEAVRKRGSRKAADDVVRVRGLERIEPAGIGQIGIAGIIPFAATQVSVGGGRNQSVFAAHPVKHLDFMVAFVRVIRKLKYPGAVGAAEGKGADGVNRLSLNVIE